MPFDHLRNTAKYSEENKKSIRPVLLQEGLALMTSR